VLKPRRMRLAWEESSVQVVLVGNIKEINLFEDKGTDNRVILKRI
jgi:hypothetical protein